MGSVSLNAPGGGGGETHGETGTGGNGARKGGAPGGSPAGPAAYAPETIPLARLSNTELDNTLRDLFAGVIDPGHVSAKFPSDGLGASGFVVPSALAPVQLNALLDAVATVARQATGALDKLLPCSVGLQSAGEKACARSFIESFARRAFRRPLEAAEIDEYLALYEASALDLELPFRERIRLLLQATLASPRFLYHWEQGPVPARREPDGRIVLSPHQLASRLSYTLWGSMPDDELLAAAESGRLLARETFDAQVQRMVTDGRARAAMSGFVVQWLKLLDLPLLERADPAWSNDLRTAMQEEIRRLVSSVLFDEGGGLRDLLTVRHSFSDATLGRLYGLGAPTGSGFSRIDLSQTPRAGILTTAAVLTSHFGGSLTAPIYRGLVIRTRLLCEEVPGPPPDVDTTLPELGPMATSREVLDGHRKSPSCDGCHRLMDPIGFAFLGFDAVGRHVPEERPGLAWNTRTEIVGLDGDPVTVDGAVELAQTLAAQERVATCFVKQMTRYALGRPDEAGDSRTLHDARETFTKHAQSFQAVLGAIVTSASFQSRAADPGEILQ